MTIMDELVDWWLYFDYNQHTGDLIWKSRPRSMFSDDRQWKIWNTKNSGNIAGSSRPDGYRRVCVNNKGYLKHNVVWEMLHGKMPNGFHVDHINTIRSDDRECNLRMATPSHNQYNTNKPRNNKSGLKGVCWDARAGKWLAQICANRKARAIGRFTSKLLAYDAYLSEAISLHGPYVRF